MSKMKALALVIFACFIMYSEKFVTARLWKEVLVLVALAIIASIAPWSVYHEYKTTGKVSTRWGIDKGKKAKNTVVSYFVTSILCFIVIFVVIHLGLNKRYP